MNDEGKGMILDGHIHIYDGPEDRDDLARRLRAAGLSGGVVLSRAPACFPWVGKGAPQYRAPRQRPVVVPGGRAALPVLPGRFADPFRFFRHAVTHRVAALAEDGLNFRDDGQFASADGGAQREGAWRSRFIASEAELQGHPLCPLGHVLRPPLTLNPAVWHEILRPGDPVLTVHIAATGPLDQEACGASFQQAVAFFADHFPDWPYRAFTCESWLLDPQLERVFSRLDGQRPDLAAAPGQSSLQRAMLAAMAAGGRFRSGGGVLFPDDLDWGKQSYRRPE